MPEFWQIFEGLPNVIGDDRPLENSLKNIKIFVVPPVIP